MKIHESIFKAYDIRGIYPDELDEKLAYAIGQGYADVVKPEGKIAVGMDVRICSPALKQALIEGITDAGVDVLDIGLISTEMIYFAVGYYNLAGGIQVTASHNPKEYGGFKMVREGAAPISADSGIFEIRDFAKSDKKLSGALKGKVEKRAILDDFVNYVLGYINTGKIKPLKIVHNPNFGFEGEVLKAVVRKGRLPLELIGLNDQPDGTFPKGRPDPFTPENRPEFVSMVKESEADLGVTWDADADRVFFCTGSGVFVEPYFMNAVFIKFILEKNRGAKIVYDPRYTWALIDSAKENGGESILERVGHSFIKERMRASDCVFAGESSGHTYFKEFWFADSGMIPLLLVLEMLSVENKTLDEILKPYFARYFISGEYNSKVADSKLVLASLEERYGDSKVSHFDGLSIEYPDWRANIRSSNTEPLLRLNVEAKSKELMVEKRDELLSMIRS